jgi:hypothetical protein
MFVPIQSIPMNNLVQKYNIPGPRYTSYPTVPYWNRLRKALTRVMKERVLVFTYIYHIVKACVLFVVVINA